MTNAEHKLIYMYLPIVYNCYLLDILYTYYLKYY